MTQTISTKLDKKEIRKLSDKDMEDLITQKKHEYNQMFINKDQKKYTKYKQLRREIAMIKTIRNEHIKESNESS